MDTVPPTLGFIFDGWGGYQTSLAHAIAPLSRDQMAWRPAPFLRSVGEVAGHISMGRLIWFQRMRAPGSEELTAQAVAMGSADALSVDAAEAVRWLEATWRMIERTLRQWTVADLARTYPDNDQGHTYAVSRQWTIWRILTHDVHHGGEIALMLGMQGIAVPELGDQGGHLTLPPLADPA